MNVWTLDYTRSTQPRRSIAGAAPTSHSARSAALRAVAALNTAAGFEHPHYAVVVDGRIAVIISTGTDADGLPDHRGVAALLHRIAREDNPLTPRT
ncbi:MAG: hypothetical protein QG597_487 [Actinomycetota bacterium]|nr:hypothetical protein [Actinomycetota bacterium]